MKGIAHATHAAITFLADRQLPWGEHLTYISRDPSMQSDLVFDSSPFATTFVMRALRLTDDPRAPAMLARAAAFLHDEALVAASGERCWSYWASRNQRLIQPDLDDTACVSAALAGAAMPPAPVDNRALCLANRDTEGLFVTWLKGAFRQPRDDVRERWQLRTSEDVCACVNANVVFHLGESDDTRAAIAFLLDVAAGKRPHAENVYYLEDLAFPYLVARALAERAPSLAAARVPLLKSVLAHRRADGGFGTVLGTALAVSALTTLTTDDDGRALAARLPALTDALAAAARVLLDAQGADGAWPTLPFYVGPYCGSAELTTGLCVEALVRARRVL